MKLLKKVVLLVATLSFAFQCRVAVEKLFNPPTLTTTQVVDISYVDPPLITICLDHQNIFFPDDDAVTLADHLRGYKSWRLNPENKTMEQMLDDWNEDKFEFLYGLPPRVKNMEGRRINLTRVYLPKFGMCWETNDYEPMLGLEVRPSRKATIFVTDKMQRVYPSLAFSSHSGEKITHSRWSKKVYGVKVEVIDNHSPVDDDDTCKEYAAEEMNYKDCVDKKLKQKLLPTLGCMPPWLSPDNHCQGVTDQTSSNFTRFMDILYSQDFTRDVLEPVLYKDRLAAELECPQPCITTNNIIVLKDEPSGTSLSSAETILKFDKDAKLTTTVVTYHLSDFLVDVGSLLGFWMGLSVFGLTDLAENLAALIKSSFKKFY